jgi:hypothetical protein
MALEAAGTTPNSAVRNSQRDEGPGAGDETQDIIVTGLTFQVFTAAIGGSIPRALIARANLY